MPNTTWRSLPPGGRVLLLLCFIFSTTTIFAQKNFTLRGTVTNEKNAPLPGVSINVKGTTRGTTTDAEGRFTLSGTPDGSVLVVSFVGYKQQEITLTDQKPVGIQLVPTASDLGEVLVVSYGTQKKRDITGAVSQLNADEVKDMPVTNIGQKMQDKFAGVQINQNDGTPGVDMTIRIRGAASINAG